MVNRKFTGTARHTIVASFAKINYKGFTNFI